MKRNIALIAAMVLILAACAGDSDSGAAQSDTEATTATEAETTTTVAETTTTEHMDDEHMDDESMHDDDHAVAGGLEIVTDGTAATHVIDVVQTEFAFEPDTFSVHKGEVVTFNVRNEGSIPHEFRITNHEAVEAHLAGGHSDHSDEMMPGEPMIMDGDLVVLLDPGQEVSVTVQFGEDATYDLVACLLPGHYEAGMEAPLEIES